MACRFLLTIVVVTLALSVAFAYDPSPLQDFCVAVNDSKASVFVNGKTCKDPNTVTVEDFFFSGLNIEGNTSSNTLGATANLIDVNKFPGLNTLGLSVARIDYAPNGLNAPHSHPRASEFLVVLKGILYVGLVTSDPENSNQENKFFEKTLYPGDVFLFPQGLVHFQMNTGNTNAIALAGFSSHYPGRVSVEKAIFGSNPRIPSYILAKAFQDYPVVIKSPEDQLFWDGN